MSLPLGLDGAALRMDTYGGDDAAIGVDRVRGHTVRVAPYSRAPVTPES